MKVPTVRVSPVCVQSRAIIRGIACCSHNECTWVDCMRADSRRSFNSLARTSGIRITGGFISCHEPIARFCFLQPGLHPIRRPIAEQPSHPSQRFQGREHLNDVFYLLSNLSSAWGLGWSFAGPGTIAQSFGMLLARVCGQSCIRINKTLCVFKFRPHNTANQSIG